MTGKPIKVQDEDKPLRKPIPNTRTVPNLDPRGRNLDPMVQRLQKVQVQLPDMYRIRYHPSTEMVDIVLHDVVVRKVTAVQLCDEYGVRPY